MTENERIERAESDARAGLLLALYSRSNDDLQRLTTSTVNLYADILNRYAEHVDAEILQFRRREPVAAPAEEGPSPAEQTDVLIGQLRTEIADLNAEVDRLHKHIAGTEHLVRHFKINLDSAASERDRMQTSMSWRLTAPLRWAMSRMRAPRA